PSGFGVLETDETHGRTVYQPFNQATRAFGSMVGVANQGELYPSLSQDGAGGIYATYMYGGTGGPVALSYSSDGGKTWTGPVQLDAYNGEANVISAVNGAGQGWVAWNNNGSVFAQPFVAADAATAPVISGSGSTNGSTITVTVTCNAFPCTVTITILGPPKVAADVAGKHKKARPTVLAKGRFTITKAGPRKLTMRLKGAGKRFFKARHGTVKVKGTFADTFKGRTVTSTKTIHVKIARTKHH
ncbi:MAG: sialidase family protein, partial [Solirubrobacteraceae bacterium]